MADEKTNESIKIMKLETIMSFLVFTIKVGLIYILSIYSINTHGLIGLILVVMMIMNFKINNPYVRYKTDFEDWGLKWK